MGLAVVRGMSVALAVVVSLIGATALAAPTKEEARQHFDAGNALVENEDYAAAASEFELSVRLASREKREVSFVLVEEPATVPAPVIAPQAPEPESVAAPMALT